MTHKKYKHQGIKYQVASKRKLSKHKKSVHESVSHDQCDFKETQNADSLSHLKTSQEGIIDVMFSFIK